MRDSAATLVLRSAVEVDRGKPLAEAHPAAPGDVAALFYTSGTTGAPKGAALTHRALVGQASTAALWPTRLHRDEAVVALPVAHIMGFAVLIGLAFAGIPAYLLPRFNPVRVLDAIEERRATIFVGVPAMYRMLDEAHAAERDLTSVRVWGSGADVMPPELAERFKRMGATITVPLLGSLGRATFAEGYGMVEVGGGVAAKVSPPFLSAGSGPLGDALGFALPGYEMRIVDGHGNPAHGGEVGELRGEGTRHPVLVLGGRRRRRPPSSPTTAGCRTGDLARKGPLGLLVFEGRRKHVIKHGGYSVYALEVEHSLEEHPDVLEAVVVGQPDDRLGEVPVAAVRLRAGATLAKAKLGAWATERLSEHKVPKRFVAVDDLPRTGTQKVQKDAVLELFERSDRGG